MDWTQQFEDLTKQWTDAQKKLWKQWADAAPTSNSTQFELLWRQMLTGWQNSVEQMLDAQAEGVRVWVDSLRANQAPADMVRGAEQFHSMTKQWIAGQKQLWSNWFQMAEKLAPNQAFGATGMNMNAQPMFKLWQETAQNMVNAQQEWLKSWTNPTGKKG